MPLYIARTQSCYAFHVETCLKCINICLYAFSEGHVKIKIQYAYLLISGQSMRRIHLGANPLRKLSHSQLSLAFQDCQ